MFPFAPRDRQRPGFLAIWRVNGGTSSVQRPTAERTLSVFLDELCCVFCHVGEEPVQVKVHRQQRGDNHSCSQRRGFSQLQGFHRKRHVPSGSGDYSMKVKCMDRKFLALLLLSTGGALRKPQSSKTCAYGTVAPRTTYHG